MAHGLVLYTMDQKAYMYMYMYMYMYNYSRSIYESLCKNVFLHVGERLDLESMPLIM